MILHRFWLNNLIEDNAEKRWLLGLAALRIGFKIAGSFPKDFDVVDVFRKHASQVSFKSPFNNDKLVLATVSQFEDELLISTNCYLEIPLPLVPLERFRAILNFVFYKQRCRRFDLKNATISAGLVQELLLRLLSAPTAPRFRSADRGHVSQDSAQRHAPEAGNTGNAAPSAR